MTVRTLSLTLLAIAALALSACGGGDKKDTSTTAKSTGGSGTVTGAEADAVKTSATTIITDAKRSCNLLTPHAIGVFTGGKSGIAGVKKCQKQIAAGTLPSSANIVVLKLDGTNASVGYTTESVTGAMQLVKIHGQWLMDAATTIPAP
jgi:hypothetical protein